MKKLLRGVATLLVFIHWGTAIEADEHAGLFVRATHSFKINEVLLSEYSDSCRITVENAHTAEPIKTITDHTSGAWNAVFSHEGNLLATCAQDGQVLIHDLSFPDSLIQFIGHTEWVLGLAFSPDDQLLASTGTDGFNGMQPGVIKIWDVATGREVLELPGHDNGSWSLDFQDNTGILASCGKDGLVKLWDPSTGDLIRTLTGHSGWVLSVDFHPAQDLVASSGVDNSIIIWDSQTGEQIHILTGHTNNVGFVKFSPDGSTLASGADDQTVRLWDVTDGTEIWNVSAGQGWINGVNFSPDGELMLTCGHDGSVVLRRTMDGMELIRFTEHTAPVLRGSFNSSGTLFATASWDNTVLVWGVCGTGIEDGSPVSQVPRSFSLSQNYPNPFNPTTTIVMEIPDRPGEIQQVKLTIYDVRGRKVRTLVDSGCEPGRHRVMWDGKNDTGEPVPSGVYLYTLRSDVQTYTRKMILVK